MQYVFGALIFIAILAAGWIFLDTTGMGTLNLGEEGTTTPPTATTTEPDGTAGTSPRPDPDMFASEPVNSVQFFLDVPTSTTAEQVRSDIYEFTFVGPESEPNTEITDGYFVSAQVEENTTLADVEADLTANPSTSMVTLAGYDALTYESESELGTEVTHYVVAVPGGTEAVIDFAVTISGPEESVEQYREEVMSMLRSLIIIHDDTAAPSIPEEVQAAIEAKSDLIVVNQPVPGSTIESPLTVSGEARGTWYFEASFPLVLTDWDGRIIAEGFATAEGEWMTEDLVPYSGTLEFTSPYSAGDPAFMQRGSLILQKANPSGLPENDDALEIPVMFAPGSGN